MPKPIEDKRRYFPFRGASDRRAYVETPGDIAPFGAMENVRPRDPVGGRERGGQRPGLAEASTTDGDAWGAVGDGPIQNIASMTKVPEITGYTTGDSTATHAAWDSRESEVWKGNFYVLRGRESKPSMSRWLSAATAGDFEDATDRDGSAVVWTAARQIAGAVNENPLATSLDNLIFKASYTTGGANHGFGSPAWTAMDDWDSGGITTAGGPWPTEDLAFFYNDSVQTDALFAAGTVITDSPLSEIPAGYIICYDIDGTALKTVGAGKRNYERPFGKTYKTATPGSGDPTVVGSAAPAGRQGATEVASLWPYEEADQRYVYFCYNAGCQNEAWVGRYDVTAFATYGFDLAGLPQSGGFQIDGAHFANIANDFTRPSDGRSPHYLAINYPRGARPTGIAVDSLGYVYVTRSSTGWGPYGGLGGDQHPDYAGAKPVTIFKVDPAGTQFEWEVATHVSSTESYDTKISTPELTWVTCDDAGPYCGGRNIDDHNVFALNASDGGIRWKKRLSAPAGTSAMHCGIIDPLDPTALWVGGDRCTTWEDSPAGNPYANLWKLSVESGEVLAYFDLGPTVSVLSIDINPVTGLIAVGTQQTDT